MCTLATAAHINCNDCGWHCAHTPHHYTHCLYGDRATHGDNSIAKSVQTLYRVVRNMQQPHCSELEIVGGIPNQRLLCDVRFFMGALMRARKVKLMKCEREKTHFSHLRMAVFVSSKEKNANQNNNKSSTLTTSHHTTPHTNDEHVQHKSNWSG